MQMTRCEFHDWQRLFERTTIMKMKFALCAVLLSIAPTMAFGQTVSVNYNHSQSFAQFHTYAFENNDPNQIANSILAQAALSDVNTLFRAKA
jgi:hypothetical protein